MNQVKHAFPLAFPDGEQDDAYVQKGMKLRDYFAAKALPSVYSEFWRDAEQGRFSVDDTWPEGVAGDAYRIADAMLKAREVE